MKESVVEFKFEGRRKISSLKKSSYFVGGIIFLILGLFGWYKFNVLSSLFVIFSIGGILNIVYGLFGKELRKEKNYISIYTNELEYKNSFKKPQKIEFNNLLDLRIEKANVEFVLKNHHLKKYDFSIFQAHEIDMIYNELEKMKASLVE